MYNKPCQKSKTHQQNGEPFAAMMTWLWQICSSHPRELLRKGWPKGGAERLSIVLLCGREKKIIKLNDLF
jgi:hypothetical protein